MEMSGTGELAPPASAQPLHTLRHEIDRLDASLVEILAERVRIAEEVGRVKARLGLMALDPGREAEIVRRAAVGARGRGVPEEGVRAVFWSVLGLCRAAVERVGAEARTAATRVEP